MTLDNLKCVFEYVEANRTDFELRLWNYQRVSRRPPSLPPSLPPFKDISGESMTILTPPSIPPSLPPSFPSGLVQGRKDR